MWLFLSDQCGHMYYSMCTIKEHVLLTGICIMFIVIILSAVPMLSKSSPLVQKLNNKDLVTTRMSHLSES